MNLINAPKSRYLQKLTLMQIPFDWSSWVEIPENSDFPIQNIPFGIFSTADKTPRVGVAIGSSVLDLTVLVQNNLLNLPISAVSSHVLNDFISLGKPITNQARYDIAQLLKSDNDTLKNHACRSEALIAANTVKMHMPLRVGDYTDFYSSKDHATNVGIMFRDPANALLPNWKHLPVGYHGRASSIVVSGAEVHRPKGQTKPVETEPPVFGPSKRVDFELEVAFVIGKPTELGDSVSTAAAEAHIFGLVLFNDLSARDIQNWEYVPLGPFLAKNFASVISPWIVPLEALEPFKVAGEEQIPEVLPYLQFSGNKNYDIALEVTIQPEGGEENVVCASNFKFMYWNMCQQLAHHTVNGCNINVGDMMASGTISGKDTHSFGSMLELAWKGTKPIQLKDGSTRVFLQDGDTNILRGYGIKDGVRIGFGECVTKILPAKN
jgi:fumarylacetoacetase